MGLRKTLKKKIKNIDQFKQKQAEINEKAHDIIKIRITFP